MENELFSTIVQALNDRADRVPDKTAMVYRGREVSYGEWRERSAALAGFLLDMGLKRGDRVGLLMEKTPEAVICFLGVAAAGGVVFPIDPNMTPQHLRFLFQLTRPVALIVAETLESRLVGVEPGCPEKHIILAGGHSGGRRPSLAGVFSRACTPLPGGDLREDDAAYLNFTSGTTGFPKGAVTTYGNLYWNTAAAIRALNLGSDDVHLCLFPVFGHPHELFARSLYLGGTTVLVEGISPKAIAGAVSVHGVTCMMGVASIYSALVRARDALREDWSSLRVPESGGMHVTAALLDAFRGRFNRSMIPVWGSTETTGIALAGPPDGSSPPGSVGTACPHYEIDVVDERLETCPPDRIGEMVVRGPGVVREYFGDPCETRNHLRDHRFFTGDLVRRDSAGRCYFAGRKTGMMKVAGMKVFPTEIEEVLSAHPQIAEVAVTRHCDGSRGEAPKAVIVLKEGERLDQRALRTYCERMMARHKIPRVFEFTEELPRTPGGKVLYREL